MGRNKVVRLLAPIVALVATLGFAQAASAALLPPLLLTAPAIAGSAQQGQPVSCSQGTWLGDPTGFTYTWQRDATAIAGATASSYALKAADVGKQITCTVVASNNVGNSLPAISLPVLPISLPVSAVPVVSGLPTLSGTAQEGQVLTCLHGSWSNDPTGYVYGWLRNGAAIAGQTGSTYKVTKADVAQAISCAVTASNALGSGVPAISLPDVPIALPAPPVNITAPVISGTAEVGKLLSCSTGTWLNDPTSYSYVWKDAGSAIAGATRSTYQPVSGDVGKNVTCTVAAANSFGKSLSISLPVLPVAIPAGLVPAETALPVISGSPEVGQLVSCSSGSWLNNPSSYAYTWQRDGADIKGATASTYTLTSADAQQEVTCVVVAANSIGLSLPAISLPISPVPLSAVPLNQLLPAISGTAQQGQTLSCSNGSWLNDPTGFLYSWESDGNAIAGQTGSTYTVAAGDVGHAITCTVAALNALGASLPAISLPVIPIALPLPGALLPVNTALPVISGIPVQGQTLSCLTGSWNNSPTGFTYLWQRTGSTIPGATGATYVLGDTDAGQAITCAVIALNAAGLSAQAVSAPVLIARPSTPAPAPAPAPVKLHAPTVIAFWINPGKLTITVKGKRRTSPGTTFHYVLDQSAGVLIEIQKKMPGRFKGNRCVAVTRRNRGAVPCARWVTVRTRAVKNAHAGTNSFRWLGKVNGNKLLTAGTYRVYLAAENSAGWSALHNKSLTAARKMVKKPKKKAKR